MAFTSQLSDGMMWDFLADHGSHPESGNVEQGE
jgi:hypothetical protein